MECTKHSDFRLGLGFLASMILHLGLGLVWGHISSIEELKPTSDKPSSQRIELENLSDAQIQKIRQVGVRGGSKDGFNAPLPQKAPKATENHDAQKQRPDISLEDLAATQRGNQEGEKTNSKRPKQEAQDASALRISRQQQAAKKIARQQRVIQNDVLKELSASNRAREVIQTTGFNLQFEPPEGIPEDELNSVEKIFYSFQRRTFTSYVTTFISNYHQLSLQSSKLRQALETQSHDLLGRVEFNSEGKTASIRIMQGSPIKEVQDLFEKTLKDLQLPNPPKDLLRKDGRFVIYYRLKIND